MKTFDSTAHALFFSSFRAAAIKTSGDRYTDNERPMVILLADLLIRAS
jgi:hypothetical protein